MVCLCLCLSGCEYRDIAFLIDSSGSVEADFQLIKEFTTRIIGRFDFGENQNRVGLVQFSSDVDVEFTFNTFVNSSKADIYETVYNMQLFKQNTNTALGLRSPTTHQLCV